MPICRLLCRIVSCVLLGTTDIFFIGQPTYNRRHAGAFSSPSIKKPRCRNMSEMLLLRNCLLRWGSRPPPGRLLFRGTDDSFQSVVYFVVAVVRVSWHYRHGLHWTTDTKPTAGTKINSKPKVRVVARAAVEVGVVVQGLCAMTRIAQAMSLALRNLLTQRNRSHCYCTGAWLVSLWCAVGGGSIIQTEVLFLCPHGRPWFVLCPGSLPAGSACRLFRSSWRDICPYHYLLYTTRLRTITTHP